MLFSTLIIIPGFLLSLKYIPNEKGTVKEKSQNKAKIPYIIYLYCFIIIIFLMMFNILPTNLSLYIKYNQLGDNTLSGIMSALVLLGGSVAGLLFSKLNQIFKEKVICIGFLNLAIGFFLISFSPNLFILIAGCFIGGCSLSFIMSQLSLNISAVTIPTAAPVALSLLVSGNNLGGFLSPIIFAMIPGLTIANKFFTVGTSAFVGAIILFLILKYQGGKENEFSK